MSTVDDEGNAHAGAPLITAEQLAKITNRCHDPALWASRLDQTMRRHLIAPLRSRCLFIANVLHESDAFRYMREVWGPTETQRLYERDTAHAWPPTRQDDRNQKAFKLGNSEVGDGFNLRGAGPMQCTGRKNLTSASLRLYGDARLLDQPGLLDEPLVGMDLAADFWRVGAGLNLTDYARKLGAKDGCDLNDVSMVEHGEVALTRACVNGGDRGLLEVGSYYLLAIAVLS